MISSFGNFDLNKHPLVEVGQAKQPLPQARGWLLEICGAGPVSTSRVHSFVLICVIACLLSFQLIHLAKRNGFSHCVGPKKKRATCLFAWFLACLFICFVWPHAMAPTIASNQKKKQATLRSRGTYLGSAGLDPSFFLLSSSTVILSSPLPPPLSKTYELNTHGKLWYTQPLPEISIRNEKPQLIFIVLLLQRWFFVFFWHASLLNLAK